MSKKPIVHAGVFSVFVGEREYSVVPVDGDLYFRDVDAGLPATFQKFWIDHGLDRKATISLMTVKDVDAGGPSQRAARLRLGQLRLLQATFELATAMWEDRNRVRVMPVIKPSGWMADDKFPMFSTAAPRKKGNR